jgi:HK97 family phage portal protein
VTLFHVRTAAYSGQQSRSSVFNNPAVPLSAIGSDDALFGLLSSSDSGEPVSIDTAVALPIVFRCVGLLSTVVASCPLNVTSKGNKLVTVPALDPDNPATMYTQFELWELVVVHLSLWGNAYVLKVRDPSGRITDLRPISPGRVVVRLDSDGNKIFEINRLSKNGTDTGQKLILTTYEVMHIPGMGYDGLTGLSPILAAKQTYGTARAGDRLAARFFKSGSQLSGIIKVKAPLADQTQADGIRDRWQNNHAGIGHSSEVAVMDADTDFEPLTIPPEALQFLESRRWSTTEIARMFGIPPHLVGDVEKSTSWGSGIEQQNIGFVAYTVAGYTGRISQRVSREVVVTRGQSAAFDTAHLLRGTMLERFSAYATGISSGWMTRNEARANENLEPIEGLSEPVLNSSMTINVNPVNPPVIG